jgi:two-component sensor histidine kinase
MVAISNLQRWLEDEPSPVTVAAGVVAGVAVPTLIRWALQPVLGDALWFATYYPAVLVVGLWLGWRPGLTVMLLSALTADYLFIPPPHSLSTTLTDVVAVLLYLFCAGLILITAALLRETTRRLNHAAAQQQSLNAELQHRVNNNLAVVQSLAAQTLRSTPEPGQFYDNFRARLIALSRAQAVLSSGDWQACAFPELPAAALEPFSAGGRIQMSGPECDVPTASCVPLVLALHELGTNASKYGALSVAGGAVSLHWRIVDESTPKLVIEWTEEGGPAVVKPSRKGLGSRLLAPQPGIAHVKIEYRPQGVRCTIVAHGAVQTSRPALRTSPAASPAAVLI